MEQVHGAGRETQGPDVGARLGVAGWWQGARDGLAEEEFAEGFGVFGPVAAADDDVGGGGAVAAGGGGGGGGFAGFGF